MSSNKKKTQKKIVQPLTAAQIDLLSNLGTQGILQSFEAHLRPILEFEDEVELEYGVESEDEEEDRPSHFLPRTRTMSRTKDESIRRQKIVKAHGPFLNRLLDGLHQKLSHHGLKTMASVDELFDIYAIWLSCVENITPYVKEREPILRKKYNMLECFVKWKRWSKGWDAASNLLESLREMGQSDTMIHLPDHNAVAENLRKLVVDTVGFMFLFAAKKQSTYRSDYHQFLKIAEELESWLRVLDDQNLVREAREKQARHITSCAIFFIGEVSQLGSNESDLERAKSFCKQLKLIPENPYLTDLCDSLYQIGGDQMHRCKDFKKASKTLDLHLETTWDIIEPSDCHCLEWFGRWSEASTLLLEVLGQFQSCDEVKRIMKSWAEKWSEKNSADKLPGPISLVEKWVEIQITNSKNCESMDGEGTLFETLIQPCSNVSREKIFQQELLFYVQMQDKNPKFCMDMQIKINSLLKKDGFGKPIKWLVESGRLRQCGFRCLKYCIQYLCEAIKDCAGYELAVAYFLRSLCTEDVNPNSVEVFNDIRSALNVLSNSLALTVNTMPGNVMIIIYNIIDMLSVKGRIDFHSDIYKVMNEIYTRREVAADRLLVSLCKSRRLSHALCPSPVLESFTSLLDREGPSESQTLIESDEAEFQYYDRCKSLVSDGCLIEAFRYALKAHHLREELFKRKFPFSLEQHGKSVAGELWNFESSSSELDDGYISPWLALQLHVESILQVGVIHEILGNEDEAKKFLDQGKVLSRSHRSTLFDIAFSSCLGQLYHKKKDWASAKEQLQIAEKLLKDSVIDGFCPKCRVVHEVTVANSLLDLSQSRGCDTESRSFEDVSTTYKSALSKLTIFSPEEEDGGVIGHANNSQVRGSSECVFSGCGEEKLWDLDLQSCVVSLGGGAPCICKSMGCLHCHTTKMKSGSVTESIKLKWELEYRRLSLKLLQGLGKCLENENQIFEACDVVLQSILVLVGPNPFLRASKSTFVPGTLGNEVTIQQNHMNLYHLLAMETLGDVLRVDRGLMLYNLCWFSLKYRKLDTSDNDHMVLNIPISKLVSWLILAFILCREVPALFQKVSRLLATLFSLSTSNVLRDALSASCKDLSGRHWVCFFHQVSLGWQFDYKLFIKDIRQCADTEDSHMAPGKESLSRLAPDSIVRLEEFVQKFFAKLPSTTIICISLLGCPYTSLVENLLSCSSAPAWMMVSRLNSKNPIHALLPLQSLPEDSKKVSFEKIHSGKTGGQWHCPWGRTVVDIVAPNFRSILEEQEHISNLIPPQNKADAKKFGVQVIKGRNSLDGRLHALLLNLEESWFGALKYMLVGESSNCSDLDIVCADLKSKLGSEFEDIDESLLKVIIFGVSKYGLEKDTKQTLLNFCLSNGCYVNDDHSKDKQFVGFDSKISAAAEMMKKFQATIQPIILVPHFDVQMLPWECIPVLKTAEVYRMPSVLSISAAYINERKVNPFKAYYLLNPDGTLKGEIDFQNLFTSKKLKGDVGCAPSVEKLAAALEDRDIFIYIGHDDARQYIPTHKIEGLQNCAGALLMGCSSASLQLNGRFIPDSAPLSYLLAGSPFVIGNLWDVIGLDIDSFTKTVFDAWFDVSSNGEDNNQRIGACMSIARNQCKTWPYLVGAAPVCYGIPRELM